MTKQQFGQTSLIVGALGVVFGDIGTSPLYSLEVVFGPVGRHLPLTPVNVMGVISLVIWALTIVVSIKFVAYIMSAANEGEGGIMALVARIKGAKPGSRHAGLYVLLGLIGAALFYGDSAITPAISVLSAVEGMKLLTPSITTLVVPLTVLILSGLFLIQKYGTALIGYLFGPVMLLWFVVISLGGAYRIIQYPDILFALSPVSAISFLIRQPALGFIALSAVVLVITGAEALYADMGHFGRAPISKAWFCVVFPALAINYLGQGALMLIDPSATDNPFMKLFPPVFLIPVVVLATFATLIASQSVISGAFSLTRQAIQLDFLPRMLIRHTSTKESGQIYLPLVNFILFIAVIFLVLIFGSSAKLANAYGVAVSGTLTIDTILYLVVAGQFKARSALRLGGVAVVFLAVDFAFLSSSLPKVKTGGWLPLLIAALVFLIIDTWIKGEKIIVVERKNLEGNLQEYINEIPHMNPPVRRIPGHAVYIGHHALFAPMALHASVEESHELPKFVVIVTVETSHNAHIPEDRRAQFDPLGSRHDGISHLSLTYGYHDIPDVPRTLRSLRQFDSELNFDSQSVAYFISMSKVVISGKLNLAPWRKYLYTYMERNALSASDYYKLPLERTTEMRSMLKL
jgi:KUP system potassium uptake protein